MDFLVNILEQGLIFGIMVLGVYITYKLLDFPDLSVDGTFPLGACITASAMVSGLNPWIATILAFIGGSMAGAITGFLHVKLRITNLLSGILVMTGVYSINLRIMGKANVALFQQNTIFTSGISIIMVLLVLTIIIKILLDLFLKTKLGFLLNAVGDNPVLVTSIGLDIGKVKFLGLALSNGLVALAGSIMAQYQGFSDVGMGTGVIVMGLASIIIGEMVFKKLPLILPTTIALLGSILYKASTAFALRMGLPATDLKLITAIIVIGILAIYGKGISLPWKKRNRGGASLVATTKSI
jgi:putative ABC transport system permease protein